MNESKARAEGLRFTGSYSHDKEEMKTKAKAIRTQSFNARVVNIPPNPLSRGHNGMGYSVYADERYHAAETIQRCTQSLANIPGSRDYHKQKYEEALATLAREEANLNDAIAKATAILNA